ncbi:unnamed protein product [Leptidea sinapis]|uniref:UMA domain-containing protein n=1 Tax=Leptidea sinapis TaxID=189913 RepID=A0A5E4QHC9_9NEOP|nr:unnamed protein product [Leptidea sinapis]
MFSAIFGKRRSSPVEDDTPAIPGPKTDDSFVVVDPVPAASRAGLYPNMPLPYPQRVAPAPPGSGTHRVDTTFNYLQGVPFSLSRELQMYSNRDVFVTEFGDLLAFLSNKINLNSYNYDFSVERSVLKEC